jgi:Sec7-like guanine-nucleotide exchange factor
LKGEGQQIDRILNQFSERYFDQNKSKFPSLDTVSILTTALVMLNTDLYNANNPRKMTKQDFILNVKNSLKEEVSEDLLKELYMSLKTKKLVMPEDREPESNFQSFKSRLFRRVSTFGSTLVSSHSSKTTSSLSLQVRKYYSFDFRKMRIKS